MPPNVRSVNVGGIREVDWHGRLIATGIWKSPVSGRVLLRGVNFVGDDQADRTVHGGPHKAVYAYSAEDYAWWRDAEGVDASPGMFGENLTVEGLDLATQIVGQRWSIGSVVLEVAQPRLPCFKLGMRMGDNAFPKRFQAALRPGAYLRVVTAGDVAAGDTITLGETPAHGVTLRSMVQALHDPEKAMALREIPLLPPFWREVADDA